MIENIHSHEGEGKKDGQVDYSFKAPKNIKQIGESTSGKKIYVEDYVFTYIKELVKSEYSNCKIAVLLGQYVKTKEGRIILINGAVEAEEIDYDTDTVFSNDTWTDVYENIKKYFSDVEVVGWCICGPEFALENQDKLKKIHLDNFAGVDKTLLKYDCIEGEEAFYIYENGSLNLQKGYYIYYDKNEDMQNYLIMHKSETTKLKYQKEDSLKPKVEEEIREQKIEENNKSLMHLMYAAGSLMVVIIIIAFATMINNSNKINVLEKMVSSLSETVMARINQEDAVVNTSTKPKDSMQVETIGGNLNSTKTEEVIGDKTEEIKDKDSHEKEEVPMESSKKDSQENVNNKDEKDRSKQGDTNQSDSNTSEENNQKSSQTSKNNSNVKYYEVQKGDTLVSICMKLYNSTENVSKIMELNGLEDENNILYGEKLIVP